MEHEQQSTGPMDLETACREWMKGCGNTVESRKPWECQPCTQAFHDHLQKLMASPHHLGPHAAQAAASARARRRYEVLGWRTGGDGYITDANGVVVAHAQGEEKARFIVDCVKMVAQRDELPG